MLGQHARHCDQRTCFCFYSEAARGFTKMHEDSRNHTKWARTPILRETHEPNIARRTLLLWIFVLPTQEHSWHNVNDVQHCSNVTLGCTSPVDGLSASPSSDQSEARTCDSRQSTTKVIHSKQQYGACLSRKKSHISHHIERNDTDVHQVLLPISVWPCRDRTVTFLRSTSCTVTEC